MQTSNMNRVIAKNGVIEFNGQFFLEQKDRAQSEFQHLTGEKTINRRVIKRFKTNVRLNAAYCKAAGIPYLHVVYPSKAMAFRNDFAAAGLALVGIYSDAHKRDAVIYPLDDLVGAEDFETRGSHLNDRGSLKIAQIAFRAVGLPIDAYKPVYATRLRQCDLAHMRGLPEQEIVTIPGFEGLTPESRMYSNGSMIPGNRGQLKYHWNAAAPVRARVLLFGDSFFALSLRVLSSIFSELIFLRCPYVMEDVANVLEPDVILTGNTERYLVNVPDKTHDRPFFANFFGEGVAPERMDPRDRDALMAVFSGRHSKEFTTWQAQAADAVDSPRPTMRWVPMPKALRAARSRLLGRLLGK